MEHKSLVGNDWVHQMNRLGQDGIPFLFILDFELLKPVIIPIISEMGKDVLYKFNETKNYNLTGKKSKPLTFSKFPVDFDTYKSTFESIKKEILYGNSFLINLTFPTPIVTNYTLRELFDVAHAKYKLYFKDKFIVSSPESFVRLYEGKIFTYPMKGTIDASIPHARQIILNDIKETSEHYTIVDLLRNDLSMVARNVKVNRFRYIDTIKTNTATLLQVSSEIEGALPDDYLCRLGDIFHAILPAGSISGAPKKKTVEIIKSHEKEHRGYYTGVFGIFDGKSVDSAVMIRYIENNNGKLLYRSGCGITCMSECEYEYQEMTDKVYVPVSRKY